MRPKEAPCLFPIKQALGAKSGKIGPSALRENTHCVCMQGGFGRRPLATAKREGLNPGPHKPCHRTKEGIPSGRPCHQHSGQIWSSLSGLRTSSRWFGVRAGDGGEGTHDPLRPKLVDQLGWGTWYGGEQSEAAHVAKLFSNPTLSVLLDRPQGLSPRALRVYHATRPRGLGGTFERSLVLPVATTLTNQANDKSGKLGRLGSGTCCPRQGHDPRTTRHHRWTSWVPKAGSRSQVDRTSTALNPRHLDRSKNHTTTPKKGLLPRSKGMSLPF